jgi:UDP-N-acetylglucosamine 3-dehydrogenase
MPMTRDLGVLLCGAGAMGRNHGRALRQLAGASLVGVVELDGERGHAAAEELGVPWWPTIEEVPGSALAAASGAVIATPTPTHEDIAIPCFERGLHVLVEKPIAHTLPSAARMIQAAEKAGRLLMVGHIERFNGAVLALPQFLEDPIHFTCARLGPYDPRILDGIILDLMIHDLDLVSHLTQLPGTPQGAVAVSLHGRREDHATASVLFGDRISAGFTASRIGQTKSRTIEVVQRQNAISVDLIRQDITIHTVESIDFSGAGNTLRQRGLVEIPFVERGQPLIGELQHFVACMRDESPCITPGHDGLRALELVQQVVTKATTISR